MQGITALPEKALSPALTSSRLPTKLLKGSKAAATVALGVLLLIFALLQSTLPLASAVRIGPDEGYEVAKATLCLKGFKLYSQVWNDQPPLHTFLITEIVKHTSRSMLGPRLLTVCAAVILLIALFSMALRINGLWVATLACALLVTSPGFIELSSSCMVEIPALAPAVAALSVLLIARERKWLKAEILAGLLFGISLQIKLIDLVLLPIAALLIWKRHADAGLPARKFVRSFATLTLCLSASFVVLNYVADGSSLWLQFQQAWSAHFAKTKSYEYGSPADRPFEWLLLLKNWDATVPAFAALVSFGIFWSRKASQRGKVESSARKLRGAATRQAKCGPDALLAQLSRQNWGTLAIGLPLVWLGLSLFVFGTHKPWWPCYYIHNEVPLCWSAAIAIDLVRRTALARFHQIVSTRKSAATVRPAQVLPGTFFRIRSVLFLLRPAASRFLAAYIVCALPWLAIRVYLQVKNIDDFPTVDNSLVLKEMNKLSPFADWLYTDEPIYSFHTGIPMPPELAVVALKRFWSGDMTNERLAADLSAIKPSVILIANDSHVLPFQQLLASDYRLVYMDQDHRLYTRRDVALHAQL
jgi:hypothetical protein